MCKCNVGLHRLTAQCHCLRATGVEERCLEVSASDELREQMRSHIARSQRTVMLTAGLYGSRHQSGVHMRRDVSCRKRWSRRDDEWRNDADTCQRTHGRRAGRVINNRRHDSRNRFAAINPTLSIIIRHFVPPLAHVIVDLDQPTSGR